MSSVSPRAVRDWRLVCRNLSVRLGTRPVLHSINLEIVPGECLSLIGPNGAGKTTLMLALLGLHRPESGDVLLDGRSMRHLLPRERGCFASYVPQVVERLPAFRVYDVVAGARYPHLPPLRPLSAADTRIVDEALAQCGLAESADRPITMLSGGERQKTFLAAALAQDAQVMFLDEPDNALDPAYEVELVRLLRRWRAGGRSIVLISHDLQLPAALGGRVVALRGGRIFADGRAEQVLDPARLSEIYETPFEAAFTPTGHRVVVPHWNVDPN